jgi:hypothetical protein
MAIHLADLVRGLDGAPASEGASVLLGMAKGAISCELTATGEVFDAITLRALVPG